MRSRDFRVLVLGLGPGLRDSFEDKLKVFGPGPGLESRVLVSIPDIQKSRTVDSLVLFQSLKVKIRKNLSISVDCLRRFRLRAFEALLDLKQRQPS